LPEVADRVILIDEDQIIEERRPNEVLAFPNYDCTQRFPRFVERQTDVA
jgi:ABC-type antimicrobial peptide transport system ATPase subunit